MKPRILSPFAKPVGFLLILLSIFLLWMSLIQSPIDSGGSLPEKSIDRAEQRWNSKRIRSYRIHVRVLGFWDQQEYSLVVRDGQIADSSSTCVPDGPSMPCCTACFEPEDFTVPGLFANAREKAAASSITFDPEYGFPSIIVYDIPGLNDEEQEWKVLEFHPERP